MVNEDAGQALADGLLHQGRRYRGVHPAGQPTYRALVPYLLPDGSNLVVDGVARRPGGLASGDLVEEALKDRLPVALDLPTERLNHRLEPVTHAEGGHPGIEERFVDPGSVVGIDPGRPTREDDGRWASGP